MSSAPCLSPAQADTLRRWFPAGEVIANLSWGLTDTVVLHVRYATGESIIKAGGPGNHHIGREIVAHEQWTTPWREAGRCARLLHVDRGQNMLATSYLPGTLVKDHSAANDADTYRQAGELLASFHAQQGKVSDDYESRMDAHSITWLDSDHHIDAVTETRLRDAIARHNHEPVELVPTHGDWQPRTAVWAYRVGDEPFEAQGHQMITQALEIG